MMVFTFKCAVEEGSYPLHNDDSNPYGKRRSPLSSPLPLFFPLTANLETLESTILAARSLWNESHLLREP